MTSDKERELSRYKMALELIANMNGREGHLISMAAQTAKLALKGENPNE